MPVKQCSRCGKDFDCCNETRGCWCENYSLSAETLKELREKYSNCLCEKCLAEFAEKPAADYAGLPAIAQTPPGQAG